MKFLKVSVAKLALCKGNIFKFTVMLISNFNWSGQEVGVVLGVGGWARSDSRCGQGQ